MKIYKLILGEYDTNCYILIKDDHAIIIDPACDANVIKKACLNYKIDAILVTHHHWDHIGALNELEESYNIRHNEINTLYFNIKIIETPGHTNDSISFFFPKEKSLFCGDFIFKNTIGRCDFPNSNFNEMQRSLKMISGYPDDIIVYPGHGPETLLGQEKKHFNIYY